MISTIKNEIGFFPPLQEIRLLEAPRAWQALGVNMRESREDKRRKVMARREKSLRSVSQKMSVKQPDDLSYDPRYGSTVSRQGKDLGATKRDTYVDRNVEDPHHPGRKVEANRVKSGLIRLYKEGAIDDNMLAVGLDFQKHFIIADYCKCTTIDLLSAGRGNGDASDGLARSIHSRKIVDRYLDLLGWPHAQHAIAAWWVIGLSRDIKDLIVMDAERRGRLNGAGDSRYWKACVVCALQIMTLQHQNTHHRGSGYDQAKSRVLTYSGGDKFRVPETNTVIFV